MKDAVRSNFEQSVSAYGDYERRTGRFSTLTRLLWAEMARHGPGEPTAVLDAGAGTGVSTAVLSECVSGPRLVALDISRRMLHENDAPARVEGDFDHLPFTDASFDAVAYTASLFLVPDPSVALAEARRVLRDGGVVGAVAPVGWFDADDRDIFDRLGRDSRSPADHRTLETAVVDEFETVGGTWRFATTADDLRLFHSIPAIAARLYPRSDPEERVRQARELLAPLEGTVEERWRWVVGTAPP